MKKFNRSMSLLLAFIMLTATLPTVSANTDDSHQGNIPGFDSKFSETFFGDDNGGRNVSHDEPQFAEDRVIVKLVNNPRARSMTPNLGIAYTESRMLNPSKVINNPGIFSTSAISDTQNNTFVLTLEETGKDAVENAIEILNANPAVEYAEPDYFYKISAVPNDPEYNAQWALKKINAEKAWEITKGSKEVVVGVIDTGIEGTHPDLIDNLWVNPNPNQNGYINDIHGYNFTGQVGGTPTDTNGHGTHVAGIIGAKGNNGIGVSGISPNVSLAWMGIHAEGENLSASAAIEALNYANNHDILITNNSWGGYGYSGALYEAILNYKGLFVAAAGNDSSDNDLYPHYPASYDCPNIISVASTDSSDSLSYFSNYGANSVDIAAPGSNILSTFLEDEYKSASGTSMASPYVAGVAALIKAENPSYDVQNIKSMILKSVVYIPKLDEILHEAGRIDAFYTLSPRPDAESITITNSKPVNLNINHTLTLTATVYPLEANQRIIWEIPEPNKAILYPGGIVTALKAGNLTTNAVVYDNPDIKDSITINVTGNLSDAIPFEDINFKKAVINALAAYSSEYKEFTAADDIYETDVQKITQLNISGENIKSMSEIKYFTNLTTLNCSFNLFTELDLSQNAALTYLDCYGNSLTKLDVSQNTALTYLDCGYNKNLSKLDISGCTLLTTLFCYETLLTELDVSKNTALTLLYSFSNNLKELDVSKCIALEELYCFNNQLTELILGQNSILKILNCSYNKLSKLELNGCTNLIEIHCSENKLRKLDINGCTGLKYLDCSYNQLSKLDIGGLDSLTKLHCNNNYMGENPDISVPAWKNQWETTGINNNGVFAYFPQGAFRTYADIFPDLHFRSYVLENIIGENITSADVPVEEDIIKIAGIESIDVSNSNITNLTGIEYFTSLKTLDCSSNKLKMLDISKNIDLTYLSCFSNQLTDLDISKNTALEILYCYDNLLGENPDNSIPLWRSYWDIPGGGTDEYFRYFPQNSPKTFGEIFPNNNFRSYVLNNIIDAGKTDTDYVRDEDKIKMAGVETVYVNGKYISNLVGIEYFTSMTVLRCSQNQLTELDLSQNTALTILDCYLNKLTKLDISQNTALTELNCTYNQLTDLDISNNTLLTKLSCYNNYMGNDPDISIPAWRNNWEQVNGDFNYLPQNPNPNPTPTPTASPTPTPTPTPTASPTPTPTPIPTASPSPTPTPSVSPVQEITFEEAFPDDSFRAYVLNKIIGGEKTGKDIIGKNDRIRIANVSSINISMRDIYSLIGIEYFTSLTHLDCSFTPLTELDVSKNTALTALYCNNSLLTELDVSKNTALKSLSCYDNNLTKLDISGCLLLENLYCYNNKLTELDISECYALEYLDCAENQLKELDISKCSALEYLDCASNQLKELDISENTALKSLFCKNNYMGEDPDISISAWKNYWKEEGSNLNGYFGYFPQNPRPTPGMVPFTISDKTIILDDIVNTNENNDGLTPDTALKGKLETALSKNKAQLSLADIQGTIELYGKNGFSTSPLTTEETLWIKSGSIAEIDAYNQTKAESDQEASLTIAYIIADGLYYEITLERDINYGDTRGHGNDEAKLTDALAILRINAGHMVEVDILASKVSSYNASGGPTLLDALVILRFCAGHPVKLGP